MEEASSSQIPTPNARTEQRGRKRNDTLPPSRAREVQRAFRARRAAHLADLEARVKEVEAENAQLREALHLPPANRAPIRSGPTGRGKLLDTTGSLGVSPKLRTDNDSGSYSRSDSGSGADSDGEDRGGRSRKRTVSSQRGLSRSTSAAGSPLGLDNAFNNSASRSSSQSGIRMPFNPGGGLNLGGAGALFDAQAVLLQQQQQQLRNAFPQGLPPGFGQMPRPEDVLQYSQQLEQQAQFARLAAAAGAAGHSNLPNFFANVGGHGSLGSGLFPGVGLGASHSSSNSSPFQPFPAQTFPFVAPPNRPSSSNSHRGLDSSSFGQAHHVAASSPLASGGFPSFPSSSSQQNNSMNAVNNLLNGFGGLRPSTPSGSGGNSGLFPNQHAGSSSPFGNNSNGNNNGGNSSHHGGNNGSNSNNNSRPSPSGRIEIGSVQALNVMDRLRVCCKLDEQSVSGDPGLLAFCNDLVTAINAQPSNCLAKPPSEDPTLASPSSSNRETSSPNNNTSRSNNPPPYLPIRHVWSILRPHFPLPFDAAVRDAMEAGSRAAKTLLRAANDGSSFGDRIICRNSNGVEIESAFVDALLGGLQSRAAQQAAAAQAQQQQGGSGGGGGGGGGGRSNSSNAGSPNIWQQQQQQKLGLSPGGGGAGGGVDGSNNGDHRSTGEGRTP